MGTLGTAAAEAAPALRRRNSISAFAPSMLDVPLKPRSQSSTFPIADRALSAIDLELVAIRSSFSYTSLKELLPCSPAGVASPTGSQSCCHEITIRNRLVKQAAWAYLQPMATSPESAGSDLIRRIWDSDYVRMPVSGLLRFLRDHVIPVLRRAFHGLLRVLSSFR